MAARTPQIQTPSSSEGLTSSLTPAVPRWQHAHLGERWEERLGDLFCSSISGSVPCQDYTLPRRSCSCSLVPPGPRGLRRRAYAQRCFPSTRHVTHSYKRSKLNCLHVYPLTFVALISLLNMRPRDRIICLQRLTLGY